MKKCKWFYLMGLAVLCIVLITGTTVVFSADETQEKKEFREAVQQKLESSIAMPLFKGDTWQKATQDEKVSFIWGICHVVSIEHELMVKFPELKVENFSAKVAEGMAGVPINDIVRKIDEYYAANPTQMDTPVVMVMWDTLVKPNIKTGIAGRPLQQ
jgi:hypothetical protein